MSEEDFEKPKEAEDGLLNIPLDDDEVDQLEKRLQNIVEADITKLYRTVRGKSQLLPTDKWPERERMAVSSITPHGNSFRITFESRIKAIETLAKLEKERKGDERRNQMDEAFARIPRETKLALMEALDLLAG